MSNKKLTGIAAGSLVLGAALGIAGQSADASQLLNYTVLGNAAKVRSELVSTLETAPNVFLAGGKEGEEAKCGEGKCGEKSGDEGKCGEGKCGDEGACGEGEEEGH